MHKPPSIAFITTCKGRLPHLMQSLPAMAAQPDTETIVVDYDCPDGSGAWVAANFPAVRVVRVAGQQVFNLARARNLGAAAANTPWLCFVDADTLLHREFAASVLATAQADVYCQCVHGRRELAGSVVVPRAAFAQLEGYDEIIEGWGGEDRDLYHRLERLGLRRLELPAHLLDTIRHGVELRTRFQRIRNPTTAWLINRMYLEVKHGMLALAGEEPSAEVRRNIHAGIEAEVIAAQAAGRVASYTLSGGWRQFMPGHEVEQILTVRVRPGSSRPPQPESLPATPSSAVR